MNNYEYFYETSSSHELSISPGSKSTRLCKEEAETELTPRMFDFVKPQQLSIAEIKEKSSQHRSYQSEYREMKELGSFPGVDTLEKNFVMETPSAFTDRTEPNHHTELLRQSQLSSMILEPIKTPPTDEVLLNLFRHYGSLCSVTA